MPCCFIFSTHNPVSKPARYIPICHNPPEHSLHKQRPRLSSRPPSHPLNQPTFTTSSIKHTLTLPHLTLRHPTCVSQPLNPLYNIVTPPPPLFLVSSLSAAAQSARTKYVLLTRVPAFPYSLRPSPTLPLCTYTNACIYLFLPILRLNLCSRRSNFSMLTLLANTTWISSSSMAAARSSSRALKT